MLNRIDKYYNGVAFVMYAKAFCVTFALHV
jgi:hypothetical protein